MRPFYSLWDIETGNSLGTYETKEEVLTVVRELLLANGQGFADALDLGYHDQLGRERTVASGAELAKLAETAVSGNQVPAEAAELAH